MFFLVYCLELEFCLEAISETLYCSYNIAYCDGLRPVLIYLVGLNIPISKTLNWFKESLYLARANYFLGELFYLLVFEAVNAVI
jgi:hypothetical protein